MCRGLCALARPPHLHTLHAARRAVLTAREVWTFAGFSAGVGLMANELACGMEAPQLDFDLQLARLPKKQVRKVAEGQEQYFIETVSGKQHVCNNFPYCCCESCSKALACSGYVCLKKSVAANQPWRWLAATEPQIALILPNGVLSGLSAAALRYFADTRLLKDALDMMTEETTWLETNTAQAKTHFSYNHVAGQSPTRRIGQGDHVQLSKDSAKKGVVVKNNGSSQPYDVSWENGQHSRE